MWIKRSFLIQTRNEIFQIHICHPYTAECYLINMSNHTAVQNPKKNLCAQVYLHKHRFFFWFYRAARPHRAASEGGHSGMPRKPCVQVYLHKHSVFWGSIGRHALTEPLARGTVVCPSKLCVQVYLHHDCTQSQRILQHFKKSLNSFNSFFLVSERLLNSLF